MILESIQKLDLSRGTFIDKGLKKTFEAMVSRKSFNDVTAVLL